jgi:hypothetical protein
MSIDFHRASRARRLVATGALGLAVAFGVSGAILLLGQPPRAQAAEAQAAAPSRATTPPSPPRSSRVCGRSSPLKESAGRGPITSASSAPIGRTARRWPGIFLLRP